MDTGKTPVTILNETMAKIRSTVLYELCSSNVNVNPPVYTMKATCDGITTLGSGRSKREAKHSAAQSMLEKISRRPVTIIQHTQPKPTIPSPMLDVTVMNTASMQELKKLCSKYQFDEPVYNDLEATGPPHALNFCVQCTVSTLTEVGTGKTKKYAKIDAADKMIKRIRDTFSLDNLLGKESSKQTKRMDTSGDNVNDNKVAHKKSTVEAGKLKINYGFKSESERKKLMENSPDLAIALLPKVEHLQNLVKECQKNIDQKSVNNVKKEFQSMLESVDIDFHHMLLETSGPTTFMMIIQLNTTPDILEMSLGATREESELRTIIKVIETLWKLLI